MTKFIYAAILSALLPLPAFADGYLRLQGMYLSSETGTEPKTKTTRTLIDLGAGWVSSNGWTLGALYATEKMKFDSHTSNRTSMGPTIGWVTRREAGPYILGTYFVTSEFDDGFEGTGYQFDLGYKFSIRRISLALQLSYRAFEYDEYDGNSVSPAYTDKRIDPYFALWFDF